ncbi:hypothetical protein N9V74_02380 [Alteromonas sp.]|nr:hypothetical protein [Alteromonas sp.]
MKINNVVFIVICPLHRFCVNGLLPLGFIRLAWQHVYSSSRAINGKVRKITLYVCAMPIGTNVH